MPNGPSRAITDREQHSLLIASPRSWESTLPTSIPREPHLPRFAALFRSAEGAGYLNQNLHDAECFHQPVLVAVRDVVKDEASMWELIHNCPLQEEWSATITPKGFFFCEVAGAMDLIFDGPGGLPVTPACWQHDLAAYREQIERWCPHCGVCLPLKGRADLERVDDVSQSNLEALKALKSPRVLAGDYVLFDAEKYDESTQRPNWAPLQYLREEP